MRLFGGFWGGSTRKLHQIGLHGDFSEEELVKRITKFRDGGRRYLDIALRLGGLGTLVPPTGRHSIHVCGSNFLFESD